MCTQAVVHRDLSLRKCRPNIAANISYNFEKTNMYIRHHAIANVLLALLNHFGHDTGLFGNILFFLHDNPHQIDVAGIHVRTAV